MKKLHLIILTFLAMPLHAQEVNTQQGKRTGGPHEKIQAARIAFITERLELTPEEAEKFWPIYREYSGKRRSLRAQLRDTRRSGSSDDELLELDLKLRQQELDLDKAYAERLKEVISTKKIVALHDAERDFTRLVLEQLRKRHERAERIDHQRGARRQPHDRSH